MALTDEQRGPRAAWLRRNRVALYGSGDGGLAKLAAALRAKAPDLDRSPTTIKGWEASDDRSPIPPDVLPALEDLFGERAPRAVQPVATAELIGALRDQTTTIGELVAELRAERELRRGVLHVAESPAEYIDDRTLRIRRAYWIARALEEEQPPLNAESIAKRMRWSTGQLAAVRRWLKGDIPDGATRAAFAQAVMLPLHVLEDPPETDHERLIGWRQEAIAEVRPEDVEAPARKRRTA